MPAAALGRGANAIRRTAERDDRSAVYPVRRNIAGAIAAVAAGVIENTVQHHADAALLCLGAEAAEVRLCAQQRIDFLVVRCVIAVITLRFKNRTEIERCYVESPEVVQLFCNAREGSAKKTRPGSSPCSSGSSIGSCQLWWITQRLTIPVASGDGRRPGR